MNIYKRFLVAILTIFSAAVLSSSATFAESKPDRTIEQQIFKKLIALPRYGVFDFINFEVRGDTVILSGKTISLGTRRDAASAVKDVPGIRNVVNNIQELPVGSFDNTIRRDLLRAFADKGLYMYLWEPNPSVRIVVERGKVTLEGYVNGRSDRDMFNILANGVFGVFDVQNHLIVGKDSRR